MVFNSTNSPICLDLAFPDVCLTPIVVPVPIPYPNIAMRVMALGFDPTILTMVMPTHQLLTHVPLTMGDNAGVNLGIMSGMVMGPSGQILPCFTVFVGGIPATKMLQPTFQNGMFGNMVGLTLTPAQLIVMTLV